MGGVCICDSSVQKYFSNSEDYILKSENYENNNIKNSQIKDLEKNIKIIPKNYFCSIDNMDNTKNNFVQNSDKNKIETNKNISDNINKEEKNIISTDNVNNTNLNNICSDNSKKNNEFVNDIYNENSAKNNDNKNHKEMEEKNLQKEDDMGENDEINYDCNQEEKNFNFNNNTKNKSDKLEPGTPKLNIKREDISSLNKGSKKVFSHFCKK